MKKYSFKSDYGEGCHENILNALQRTNLVQQEGYGVDEYSIKAKKFLHEKIGNNDSDIYFVSGGTQANLIAISAVLKHHEAIIAVRSSHISLREAGAIEATGHMIINMRDYEGKITIKKIQEALDIITLPDHMVRPKLVFISDSTELGTIYKKKELEEISSFCKKNNLYLYLDGARLGSALMSPYNDLTLKDISKLVDIFYIGGTKNGALLGEAIIINNEKMKEDFRYNLKQKGALLAKGRILGLQFYELFKENLFFDLAKHINDMAMKLSNGIKEKGYEFMLPPESNQIFPILPNILIDKLKNDFEFYVWKKIDDNNSVLRLVTSWSTEEEYVDRFLSKLDFYS